MKKSRLGSIKRSEMTFLSNLTFPDTISATTMSEHVKLLSQIYYVKPSIHRTIPPLPGRDIVNYTQTYTTLTNEHTSFFSFPSPDTIYTGDTLQCGDYRGCGTYYAVWLACEREERNKTLHTEEEIKIYHTRLGKEMEKIKIKTGEKVQKELSNGTTVTRTLLPTTTTTTTTPTTNTPSSTTTPTEPPPKRRKKLELPEDDVEGIFEYFHILDDSLKQSLSDAVRPLNQFKDREQLLIQLKHICGTQPETWAKIEETVYAHGIIYKTVKRWEKEKNKTKYDVPIHFRRHMGDINVNGNDEYQLFLFPHLDENGYSAPTAVSCTPNGYFGCLRDYGWLCREIDPYLTHPATPNGQIIATVKSSEQYKNDPSFPFFYVGMLDTNGDNELEWVVLATHPAKKEKKVMLRTRALFSFHFQYWTKRTGIVREMLEKEYRMHEPVVELILQY